MRTRTPSRPSAPLRAHAGAATLIAALSLTAACQRGQVDTTKTYYEDSEAPAFQVQIWNGVETKVPWAEVPEESRYFTKYDQPSGGKLIERVPIVKVTTISQDKDHKPLPPGEKAFYYQSTEEGLNPTFTMCSMGGEAH